MSRGRYYHTPLGETHVLTVLTHLWFAAKIAPVEEQKCFYEETDRAHVRERANEGIKFLFSRLRERMDDCSRWEVLGCRTRAYHSTNSTPTLKGSLSARLVVPLHFVAFDSLEWHPPTALVASAKMKTSAALAAPLA